MKALFTFLFLSFFTCTSSLAQKPTQTAKEWPSHIIGFRAGGNLSTFTNSDPFTDLYLGYHAGMFLDVLTGKKYGFGLEVNYVNQGGSYNNIVFSKHYLAIPALFNLYVSEVALQAGVYAAPLLDSQTPNNYYRYYSTGGNDMDLGLAIGIKRALGTAGVGVRYYHGLQSGSANQKLELSLRLNLLEAKRKTLAH